MNKLLPCPFCGGEAAVFSYGGGGYDAKCRNPKCLAKIEGHDTEAEAIAAWNSRAERTCRKVIPDEMEGYVFCSECGAEIGEYGYPNYCPNCGRKVVKR